MKIPFCPADEDEMGRARLLAGLGLDASFAFATSPRFVTGRRNRRRKMPIAPRAATHNSVEAAREQARETALREGH